MDLLHNMYEIWLQMSPYLLLGFLIAGILSVLISAETVQKHLGYKGFFPIFKASALGVPLPLCSCSVIPVATSLRKNGASSGATTSFLASTPQTGVDSILLTFSLLGPIIAILRPIVAFLNGIFAGLAVDIFGEDNEITEAPKKCCCHKDKQKPNIIIQILQYAFITLPKDIAKPLFFGILFAGLIETIVPDEFLLSWGNGILGMLVMITLSTPLYVCATASVPIAAVLVSKGASVGVALVFLMAGPATNIATITVLWKVLGRRNTIIYLLSVLITAIAAGCIVDYFFVIKDLAIPQHIHESFSIVDIVLGGCLLLLLVNTFFAKKSVEELSA